MNLENKKQLGIVLLAVGLGLVAAVLTGNYIQTGIKQETKRLSKEYETKKIRPLVREIEALRKEMKRVASQQANVARQVGKTPQEAKPAIPKSSLALRTPAGKRAYTFRIDSLSAVGGLINPGDYVDFIAHMNMPNPASGKTERITSIIFQNIQILAVGTNLQSPGGYERQHKARSLDITIALTPQESGLMSFVQRNGSMQLILRAPAETETQIVQVSSWRTLSDYVFEKQGTELAVPESKAMIKPLGGEEVKPVIQIFQGGREL